MMNALRRLWMHLIATFDTRRRPKATVAERSFQDASAELRESMATVRRQARALVALAQMDSARTPLSDEMLRVVRDALCRGESDNDK